MAGTTSQVSARLRAANKSGLTGITLLLGTTMLVSTAALATPIDPIDPPTAPAPGCEVADMTATCTGDQSAGLAVTDPFVTLEVNDLTQGIAPADGTAGIAYETETTNVTLLSNTGEFAITTNGADGILVGSKDGDVYINHEGDITATGGRGIHAYADQGEAVIEGAGNVTSTLDAISTNPRLGGAALNWEGNITSTEGRGIDLKADNGVASAAGSGAIVSQQDAVTLDSRGAGADTSFNWTGDITSHGGSAVLLNADDGGVSVTGSGTVMAEVNGFDLDARGEEEDAWLGWEGDITATTGFGARVYSANGGADIEGSGTVNAGDFAFHVLTENTSQPASLKWTGDITSQLSFGVLVETVGGAATVQGSGTVQTHTDALTANAIGGDANVIWTGDVTSTTGRGLVALSSSGGASVNGSGTVMTELDAITASNTAGTTATVTWNGDITSTSGRGVYVFSSSGATNLNGSGTIMGGTDGVSISNTGSQTAALGWSGDITGGTGYGVYIYSANGPATASGTGAVSGALDAFHLETEGSATASLNWTGDITSTGGNGVHITTAQGAVSTQTNGLIDAEMGGIYISSGSANTSNTVSVEHSGNIIAGGVGVEAHSPVAPVTVKVTGDIDSGSYGIHAESQADATVTVEQTGTLDAGNTGIHAYSANGDVNVKQNGYLEAYGDGILAQNEGDGTVYVSKEGDILSHERGIAALSSTGNVVVRMSNGNIDSGGTGIQAGNESGETVTVEMTGNIDADGAGVLASSSNGQVWVTVDGDIDVGGDGASAINEGSGEVGVTYTGEMIAGGNGLVAGSATGNATTTLTEGSSVSAAENGMSLAGFGNLSANIGEGATVTGGEGFAGVFFDTGLQNTVTNHGTINNAGGVDEYAILAEDNDVLVENYGTISGNVVLGPWANDFNNYEGSLLESGTILNLGTGNTVTVEGTLSPGGKGTVMTTALTGNLETTATSTLLLDLDMGAEVDTNDLIEVSGVASLEGAVTLNFVTASATPQSYVFISTGEGVTLQDLSLSDNPFVTASIETINDGDDVQVTISELNFAPEGLTGTAGTIADYLQRAMAAGGDGLGELGALVLNSGDLEGAQAAYDDLAPTPYVDALDAGYLNTLNFTDNLMSCSVPSGLYAEVAEGSCDWTKLTYSNYSQDSAGGGEATTVTTMYTTGMQRALKGDWRGGFGFGFSGSSTSNPNGDSSHGTTFHAGASLKYAPGPYAFSAALTGNWGDRDTTRFATVGGSTQTLTGNFGVSAVNLKLRGSYVFGSDSFFIKPRVDLDTTLVRSDAFTETGGSAALSVESTDQVVYSLSPSLEFGTTRRDADGSVMRTFARIGTTVFSDSDLPLTATLASDGTGVTGFSTTNSDDGQIWSLAAGFTAFNAGGWSAEAQYNLNFDSHSQEHVASLKMRKTF
ncbi:MAG: autotransporter domain-containing protein [Rhodobacteraceae bacterium]|nr:autotransporter domain-containing protein [Paracoccaceae bacterium]MBR9820078.1 autotransporter domain-containing protein [Paracoccaceae bacterium]